LCAQVFCLEGAPQLDGNLRTLLEENAGEQYVIPGAEKVSDAEVAKRKAREPLKPRVGQKPADEGLFGDWANQTDLVDLAGRSKAAKP
jgi:hypothetical protein